MRSCNTPEDIASTVSLGTHRIIAIDGFQASGKTTLAKALADLWNLPVVSADDYLNRNQGAFFAHLRLKELSAALTNSGPCIFEGVCALQVLEAISVRPDIFIYVKQMAIWGWVDEDELDSGPPQPYEGNEEPDPIQRALQRLWIEVAQYHKRYRPHEVANLFYERSAD